MSLSLPPEILDLIVDHLHDEPTTLKECCLVSKPWIPRTRIHLFNNLEFRLSGPTLESWMETFPDPSNSPAHYTRSLHLSHFEVIAVAISDALPWVHSFNQIVELGVTPAGSDERHTSYYTRLHGLSPTLKCLRISQSFAPLSEVLDFIFSFPLLEDLSLRFLTTEEYTNEWPTPPNQPKFTGSLLLDSSSSDTARKLAHLSGCLHFSKITVSCPIGDCDLAEELVSTCFDTLESLCVDFYLDARKPWMRPSLDLSKVTRLKDVEFQPRGQNVKWISAALRTIRSENLQQITIRFYTLLMSNVLRESASESTRLEWKDLDHLLVELWITRSIRPVFTYERMGAVASPDVLVPKLLPELVNSGVINFV